MSARKPAGKTHLILTASRDEVAKYLDLTASHVSDLVKRGILPKVARGKYDLQACTVAYIRHVREQVKSDPDRERGPRWRLEDIKAEREAIKLAHERHELVWLSDLQLAVANTMEGLRFRFQNLGLKVAGRDAATIQGEVDDVLRDMATRLDETVHQLQVSDDRPERSPDSSDD